MRQYAPDKTPYDLGDNAMLADYLYTLDASGQRTKLVETFWFDPDNIPATPTVPKSTTYDWTYDNDHRLTSESIDGFDNAVDRTDTFVMDLFGNQLKRTTDLASTPGVVDEVIRYWYDSNDRLQSEAVDYGNDGQNEKTTTYSWNETRQAAKTVEQNGSTVSTQQFSYDLQGRLASVVTTPASGAKTRVDYRYDSNSIRISATEFTDANGNGVFSASEKTSTTEYLIDHSNFTGYAQTIVETTKNAAGQATKRIAYTFGTDEITQTTVTYDSSGLPSPASILTFGHDAHGSVRVLFDAIGALSQALTYAAYGELLAIHNGIAQAVGTVGANGLEAQALTNLRYSGESFDSRIGQQYLRARWYQTDAGRFGRLDPFAGNPIEPLSWNKFVYARSSPVNGIDPTGLDMLSTMGSLAVGGTVSALVGVGIKVAYGRANEITVVSVGRDFFIGAAASGIFLTVGWGWKAFQAWRAASAAGAAAATGSVATAIPAAIRGLSEKPLEVIVNGAIVRTPFEFVGSSWQKQALLEYLEFAYKEYLKKVPTGIAQSVDEVIKEVSGTTIRYAAGKTVTKTGEIVLAKSANLGTLAEEMIHFMQLSSRNLIGTNISNATKATMDYEAKVLLKLWGFVGVS